MSWAWNDPIDETLDWSSIAVQEMFREACYERLLVRYHNFSPIGIYIPSTISTPTAAGDDVQHWERYYNMQILPMGFFIAPVSLDGQPYLTPITQVRITSTSQWRRKRPREIFSTSDNYTGRAVGHTAILIDASVNKGRLYTWDGTTWAPADPGAKPDLMASDLAAPFNIVGGPMQAGDYIGPWIFEDLRDFYNDCVWCLPTHFDATVASRWYTNSHPGGSTGGIDEPSRAAAQAAAEADFAAATPSGWIATSGATTATFNFSYYVSDLGYNGDESQWGATTATCFKFYYEMLGQPTFCNHGLDIYIGTQDGTGNPLFEYDDRGLPFGTPDTMVLLHSEGASNSATFTSAEYGSHAVPPWPSGKDNIKGFMSYKFIVIAKYDVAGGFAYTAST